MKTNTKTVHPEIAIQSWLRPALNPVFANKDHAEFSRILADADRLLSECGLETAAADLAAEKLAREEPEAAAADFARQAVFAVKALRFGVLKMLLGNPSFRQLAVRVGDSDRLADFCRLREIDRVRGTSKSTLHRLFRLFDEDEITAFHQRLTEVLGTAETAAQAGLENPLDTSVNLADGTCVEANIHFPVDWTLLRDAALTLLKAVLLIRREGLLCRMPQSPETFIGDMNALCVEMTHSRRRSDGRKRRKKILRRMKSLLTTIAGHARRHRDLLEKHPEAVSWSEAQTRAAAARIERMLEKVPLVIRQAHERLIGERQVPNANKILSLHEEDIHVIVRGKAGKEVEFGNTLFLCENAQGYILDWKLYRESAPCESDQLAESLERQNRLQVDGEIEIVCADRGFGTAKTRRRLEEAGIYDATCPRDPRQLEERMGENLFTRLQKRRGSTEGRIAILRQKQGRRLRDKGFAARAAAVGWSVLSHNLWLVSRLLAQQDADAAKAA